MKVAQWGNSLAIRLPASVVEALDLKPGDDIEVRVLGDRAFAVARDESRRLALDAIRGMRRSLPPGWTFDRDEANRR